MEAEAYKMHHLGVNYQIRRSTISDANNRRSSDFFKDIYFSENYSEEALAKEIGASSIGFVSVEGILGSLEDIIPENFGYCTNCFRHFE